MTITHELTARAYSGSSDQREVKYLVTSTVHEDDDAILNYMESNTAGDHDGMPRQELRITMLRDMLPELWQVTAIYSRNNGTTREDPDSEQPNEIKGAKKYNYGTTSALIRHAKTIGRYGLDRTGVEPTPPDNWPTAVNDDEHVFDNQDGINIDSLTKQPQGTTLPVATADFTIPFRTNRFTRAWNEKIRSQLNTMNSDTFEGYDSGEVRFARFTGNTEGVWTTCSFDFAVQPNESDVEIGRPPNQIVIPSVKGWHLIHGYWQKSGAAQQIPTRLHSVFVSEPHAESDLNDLFVWVA